MAAFDAQDKHRIVDDEQESMSDQGKTKFPRRLSTPPSFLPIHRLSGLACILPRILSARAPFRRSQVALDRSPPSRGASLLPT